MKRFYYLPILICYVLAACVPSATAKITVEPNGQDPFAQFLEVEQTIATLGLQRVLFEKDGQLSQHWERRGLFLSRFSGDERGLLGIEVMFERPSSITVFVVQDGASKLDAKAKQLFHKLVPMLERRFGKAAVRAEIIASE